jgi:glycosyltransferase involved in cell wall biosynthesis
MTDAAAPASRLAGRVVVLIPALNEAESIGAVVRAVPATVRGVETATVVIDDGSSDGTAERAEEAGAIVARHRVNRGGGAALRTGYELACEGGARVVVTLDADGQHLPEEMPALVAPVLEDRADLVLGSRVLGSAEPGTRARELGIALFGRMVSLLVGRRFTDVSNSYRAMTCELLSGLDLREDQFHASELLIDAVSRGARTVEVPITVASRSHGTTKKPTTLRYGMHFARAIVMTRARSLGRRGGTSRRSDHTSPPAEQPEAARPPA